MRSSSGNSSCRERTVMSARDTRIMKVGGITGSRQPDGGHALADMKDRTLGPKDNIPLAVGYHSE